MHEESQLSFVADDPSKYIKERPGHHKSFRSQTRRKCQEIDMINTENETEDDNVLLRRLSDDDFTRFSCMEEIVTWAVHTFVLMA